MTAWISLDYSINYFSSIGTKMSYGLKTYAHCPNMACALCALFCLQTIIYRLVMRNPSYHTYFLTLFFDHIQRENRYSHHVRPQLYGPLNPSKKLARQVDLLGQLLSWFLNLQGWTLSFKHGKHHWNKTTNKIVIPSRHHLFNNQ